MAAASASALCTGNLHVPMPMEQGSGGFPGIASARSGRLLGGLDQVEDRAKTRHHVARFQQLLPLFDGNR